MQLSELPTQDEKRPSGTDIAAGYAADLVRTLRFYSRLPTGNAPHRAPDLERTALVLPVASLVIGAVPALVLLASALVGLPALFAAGLGLCAWLLVTGAMAEDALADSMDGLFGGNDAARRLAIMRDSRHGTYGASALTLDLLLRAAALAALVAINPWMGALCWLAAATVSRSAALWLLVELPPARADGASAGAGRVSPRAFIIGATIAALLAVVLAVPFAGALRVLLGLALAAAIAFSWSALCRRKVGGQTGDLIGAAQALIEVAFLGVLLID